MDETPWTQARAPRAAAQQLAAEEGAACVGLGTSVRSGQSTGGVEKARNRLALCGQEHPRSVSSDAGGWSSASLFGSP